MSKFSPEDRERILQESFENLQRAEAERANRDPREDEDALAEAMRVPVESVNDRHRRELLAQEEQFEQVRAERRAAQRRREAEPAPIDLDQRIAVAVAAMRAEVLAEVAEQRTVMLEALIEGLAEQRKEDADDLERSIRSLTIELGECRAALSEVRSAVAATKSSKAHADGEIIDLPPLFAGRTVVN
jgi:hypothetical protein